MNLILDTHVLLWFTAGDERLSREGRRLIEDEETICYVSMASWWEIAIKSSLGKLRLDDPLDIFMAQRLDEGYRLLSIEPHHLPPLVELPFHHRDPFDRLIVSQALQERMPVCSMDERFAAYGIRVIW